VHGLLGRVLLGGGRYFVHDLLGRNVLEWVELQHVRSRNVCACRVEHVHQLPGGRLLRSGSRVVLDLLGRDVFGG
jgi:hypothetical protein